MLGGLCSPRLLDVDRARGDDAVVPVQAANTSAILDARRHLDGGGVLCCWGEAVEAVASWSMGPEVARIGAPFEVGV